MEAFEDEPEYWYANSAIHEEIQEVPVVINIIILRQYLPYTGIWLQFEEIGAERGGNVG